MSAAPMPLRRTSPRFRRAVFSVVLLALALAQTLGLMHRIAHAPRAAQAHVAGQSQLVAATGAHWLQALFAGHGHDGCDLYDQLSHADLLGVDPVVVVLASLPPTGASTPSSSHIAAQAAGFLARGPPSIG